MKESARIPGEPFRYINAKGLAEQDLENVKKLEVKGDGELGVPVRTASKVDAERIGKNLSHHPYAKPEKTGACRKQAALFSLTKGSQIAFCFHWHVDCLNAPILILFPCRGN